MDLFHFLLASVDVAAQVAGTPVVVSLAREITQSCYILSYSPSPFALCLSLSYDMICILVIDKKSNGEVSLLDRSRRHIRCVRTTILVYND